jgi:uncharacterized integral membrane protein (TIGR00697 family)
MVAFVTLLLCTNLIGAAKVVEIAGFSFGGTLIFFPLTYLFGDVLTEVYGYKRSRRVIWSGFIAMGFASFVTWLIVVLPPAPGWEHQKEVEIVFQTTPRLAFASMLAYFSGEFINSYVVAKMKIFTKGRQLWTRLFLSTVFGEAVDSIIIFPLAFYGIWPTDLIIKVMITSYVFKVLWELFAMPLTYPLVRYLKRIEDEDYYDYNTNFSPFALE